AWKGLACIGRHRIEAERVCGVRRTTWFGIAAAIRRGRRYRVEAERVVEGRRTALVGALERSWNGLLERVRQIGGTRSARLFFDRG
ncbi:hypothetical protein, partial [Mesorhizobium sp.]|uniref:hypothetical protein n=1 Tax=Mesorhizobium sp. TaxID=1871066 RepID=UPI00257F3C7E